LSRPLLIITRPAEEAGRTSAAAQAAGFATLSAPLLRIEPLPWDLPHERPDALLFTSARSPDLVSASYPDLRSVPAYAVGARTADVATEAGFRVVGIGEDDGSAALGLAARDGCRTVLHLAGESTAALCITPGLTLVRRAVYAARRVDVLPPAAVAALRTGEAFAVLLFSARTARHFARLLDRSGIERSDVRLVCLSSAVADAAGEGWGDGVIAAEPSLAGALAAARSLWQGSAHG
jgi:uroporphyrinogen-III synthase